MESMPFKEGGNQNGGIEKDPHPRPATLRDRSSRSRCTARARSSSASPANTRTPSLRTRPARLPTGFRRMPPLLSSIVSTVPADSPRSSRSSLGSSILPSWSRVASMAHLAVILHLSQQPNPWARSRPHLRPTPHHPGLKPRPALRHLRRQPPGEPRLRARALHRPPHPLGFRGDRRVLRRRARRLEPARPGRPRPDHPARRPLQPPPPARGRAAGEGVDRSARPEQDVDQDRAAAHIPPAATRERKEPKFQKARRAESP